MVVTTVIWGVGGVGHTESRTIQDGTYFAFFSESARAEASCGECGYGYILTSHTARYRGLRLWEKLCYVHYPELPMTAQ